MKKFTAIILALLLMFSLSITAFAAEGETKVSISVDSAQISVTVPTALAIVAKVDGGPATVTSPDAYKIVNSSAIPVKVDTIAVALKDGVSDWAFKSTAIDANTAPTVNNVNDIFLSVNGLVLAVRGATEPTNKTSWNISASSELALPLVCSTSRLNTTTTVNDLITITYVVSAGSHA